MPIKKPDELHGRMKKIIELSHEMSKETFTFFFLKSAELVTPYPEYHEMNDVETLSFYGTACANFMANIILEMKRATNAFDSDIGTEQIIDEIVGGIKQALLPMKKENKDELIFKDKPPRENKNG